MALFTLLVLFVQMIDRQEGNDDGGLVGVGLVLGIVAVAGHLALFQTLGTVEHDEHDEDVGNDHSDPLAYACQNIQRGHGDTGPEQDLTEVVGAADDSVQLLGSNHVGPLSLLLGLLLVGNSLQADAEGGDGNADPLADGGSLAVEQPEGNAGGLGGVQDTHGDPHEELDEHGDLVAGGFSQGLTVGSILQFPDQQEAGQAETAI